MKLLNAFLTLLFLAIFYSLIGQSYTPQVFQAIPQVNGTFKEVLPFGDSVLLHGNSNRLLNGTGLWLKNPNAEKELYGYNNALTAPVNAIDADSLIYFFHSNNTSSENTTKSTGIKSFNTITGKETFYLYKKEHSLSKLIKPKAVENFLYFLVTTEDIWEKTLVRFNTQNNTYDSAFAAINSYLTYNVTIAPLDYLIVDSIAYVMGVGGEDAEIYKLYAYNLNRIADYAIPGAYSPNYIASVDTAISSIVPSMNPRLVQLTDSTFFFIGKNTKEVHLNGTVQSHTHLSNATSVFNHNGNIYLGGKFLLQNDTVPLIKLIPGTTQIDSNFILQTPANQTHSGEAINLISSANGFQVSIKYANSGTEELRYFYDSSFNLLPISNWNTTISEPQFIFLTTTDTFYYNHNHIQILGDSLPNTTIYNPTTNAFEPTFQIESLPGIYMKSRVYKDTLYTPRRFDSIVTIYKIHLPTNQLVDSTTISPEKFYLRIKPELNKIWLLDTNFYQYNLSSGTLEDTINIPPGSSAYRKEFADVNYLGDTLMLIYLNQSETHLYFYDLQTLQYLSSKFIAYEEEGHGMPSFYGARLLTNPYNNKVHISHIDNSYHSHYYFNPNSFVEEDPVPYQPSLLEFEPTYSYRVSRNYNNNLEFGIYDSSNLELSDRTVYRNVRINPNSMALTPNYIYIIGDKSTNPNHNPDTVMNRSFIRIDKNKTSVGIATQSETEPIVVYPNPATTQLNILTEESNAYQVEIYSISGTLVMQKMWLIGNKTLDVSSLSRGTYLVQINHPTKKIHTFKVVID